MTSFKQEPYSETPGSQSNCFDPDNFINYDQAVVPTPSISPLSTHSKPSLTPTSSSSNSTNHFPIQPSPRIFAPPTHQYGQHKQQAGLSVGALATTYGVNQIDNFSYSRNQQYYPIIPSDGYFGMNNTDDLLDFGSAPKQTPSGDMDLDFSGSSLDLDPSSIDFINPAAIVDQESTPQPQAPQIHPGRVYPGHHQQAALAKAQAEAQKQQQAIAQQQRSAAGQHSRQSSRGGSARPPTDPHVEESISRLLNQMRHSSVASSNDDDAATPTASGSLSHSHRTKKDEEDMDEDERLLASEEGKKLSSKERRQLRNKVSARAFRSRRKEYIGQLEGEIAAKSQEADELRAKNEALMVENARLGDLTRMLLSSPAFSSFLADLSGTGAPNPITDLSRLQSHASTSQSQPSAARKDVNPNQVAPRQTQPQGQNNLTMIPEESSFDYTTTESANTGYTDNMDFGLYDAQVYAVTEVPQGPAVDTMRFANLHGKSSNFVGPCPSVDDIKDEPLTIESMPPAVGKMEMPEPIETPIVDLDIEASDPAFALFIDQPIPSSTAPLCAVAPEDRIFGEIELEKAFGRVELIVEDESKDSEEISSATIERFERLCSRLDAASARILAITPHL